MIVNFNDIQSAMRHPDKSTGQASASEEETWTYNAAGQMRTDGNGKLHTYSYDVLGRTTADAVTTLGSGVDGAVRRLEFSYDTAGRPFQFTSFDASTGVNVVNPSQGAYAGLGRLIDGVQVEKNTRGGGGQRWRRAEVEYAFNEMMVGGLLLGPLPQLSNRLL